MRKPATAAEKANGISSAGIFLDLDQQLGSVNQRHHPQEQSAGGQRLGRGDLLAHRPFGLKQDAGPAAGDGLRRGGAGSGAVAPGARRSSPKLSATVRVASSTSTPAVTSGILVSTVS